MIKKIIKYTITILCLLFLSGCVSVPPIDNKSTFSQFKKIDIKSLDKNNDNVIDKQELESYQECNTPDSSTPLYVTLSICILTILACFLPKGAAFVKNKIKK